MQRRQFRHPRQGEPPRADRAQGLHDARILPQAHRGAQENAAQTDLTVDQEKEAPPRRGLSCHAFVWRASHRAVASRSYPIDAWIANACRMARAATAFGRAYKVILRDF